MQYRKNDERVMHVSTPTDIFIYASLHISNASCTYFEQVMAQARPMRYMYIHVCVYMCMYTHIHAHKYTYEYTITHAYLNESSRTRVRCDTILEG